MSETEPISDPRDVIDENMVSSALETDKGPEAKLITWKVKDFIQKGDNYTCLVTGLEGRYSIENCEQNFSYVAKMNTRAAFVPAETMTKIFTKEGEFFRTIGPSLSEVLISIEMHPLRIPQCFYSDYTPGKEILICEDLRSREFKMCNRQKGLDMVHTNLIIKELARLHAASKVLLLQNPDFSFENEYSFFKNQINKDNWEKFAPTFEGQISNAVAILEKIGGYENVQNWLKTEKESFFENVITTSFDVNDKFKVLCHGDCWNNNLLFR